MLTYEINPTGSTGTDTSPPANFIRNLHDAKRLEVEFEVTAVGATPTVTWNAVGLVPDGDPTVAADWITLALLQADSTVAASVAGVTRTAVGKDRRYIDGLDKRFYDAIGIIITANTNVTFRSKLKRQD
jgi:hypothetical protein